MKRVLNISQVVLTVFLLVSCSKNNGTDLFTKSTDGVDICYSSYGKGKELIAFVHGWSCDKTYWDKQVKYFKNDYQVVTIDLGGHGKSGLGRENWTMSSFGDDVNSVLKQFTYKKVYLVGHSMGADVIVEAAASYNSDNIELFLIDRFGNTPVPWKEKDLDKFLIPFEDDFVTTTREWVIGPPFFIPESNPDLVEWVSNDMSQANIDVALSAFRNLFLNDIKSKIITLKNRGIKMTAINSDFGNTDSEDLKEIGINTVIMSKVGHFLMMENPDEFNKVILELIN